MDKLLQIIKNDLAGVVVVSNINGKEFFLNFNVENLGLVFSKLFSYKGVNSKLRDIAVIKFLEDSYGVVYNIFLFDEMISVFLETEINKGKHLPSVTKFYKNANFLERKIEAMFDIDIKNSVMDSGAFFGEGVCIR